MTCSDAAPGARRANGAQLSKCFEPRLDGTFAGQAEFIDDRFTQGYAQRHGTIVRLNRDRRRSLDPRQDKSLGVEAQKLVERPTMAFRQTEPLGAGVIFIRTPSCSKYLSCSATQIAAKAKLGTAVSMEISGNLFLLGCGLVGYRWQEAKHVKHDNSITSLACFRIAESPSPLGLDLYMFFLRLPAQRFALDCCGHFVHDDHHDHQGR